MLTVQDISGVSFQTAAGYGTKTPAFYALVNELIPRLMQRGDWPGLIMPLRVCVRRGCVTWPRYVANVRWMRDCRRNNIAIRNPFGDFLSYQGHRHLHEWQGWLGQERRMVAQFNAPTYNDIYGPNCTVRVIPLVQEDNGAVLTIYGTDNNNQPLQTNNGDGTWSAGIQVAAGIPFGSSNTFVSKIERVVKPITQSNIMLYAYDSVQNAMYDLAVYEPSETSPSYLRYQLEGGRGFQASCSNQCLETVVALAKLKFIPVSTPSDGILFLTGAEGGLKLGIQALKREEANDFAGARAAWQGAVEELNRQFEDYFPDSQFVATNEIFGGRSFTNKMF